MRAAKPMSIFLIIIVCLSLIIVQSDFVSRANAPIHRDDERHTRQRTANSIGLGSDVTGSDCYAFLRLRAALT